MNRGFLKELRATRRAFATLATVLLLLPLLFALLPRPSIASADYIAELTGSSICSSYADPLGDHSGKQDKEWPCQNCLPGSMASALGAVAEPVVLALLVPQTGRGQLLHADEPRLVSQANQTSNPARAPPLSL
jgi:hypothetical protein